MLAECLDELDRQGLRKMFGSVHVALAECMAGLGAWGRFDRHLESARLQLLKSKLVHGDLARCAARAGDLARTAGEKPRAQRAYALAADQWRALAEPARADTADAAALDCGEPSSP